MNNSKIIKVGVFGSPIGLHGAIKVNFLTSTFKVFKDLQFYTNSNNTVKWDFKKISMVNNKCIVHPTICKNREDAKNLTKKEIFSYKNYFPLIEPNKYYISDLMTCKIYLTEGECVGEVIGVDNFGAGDLLETRFKNKNIYIPMNDENLISVNLKQKKIIINPIKGILD